MIYLSLGSNMGDRMALLAEARERLAQETGVEVVGESPIYETEAWPNLNQDPFLNQVLALETSLPPHALLEFCQSIEADMGRRSKGDNAPRPIDIDILLHNGDAVDLPDLKIPHPRMAARRFVLVPLLDLAPDLADPVTGRKYRDILAELKDNHGVNPFHQTQ